MKRTKEELQKAFSLQLGFLRNSCTAFDKGEEGEAVRIAATLRVLLHDNSSTRNFSLLGQLGIKDNIQFIDSAEPIDPVKTGRLHKGRPIMTISAMPGLFMMTFTRDGTRFAARLQNRIHSRGAVSFDEWWEDGCIPGHNGARHSRSWLIRQMANKEGGAHIDPEITKGYLELKTTSFGMTAQSNGVQGFINSPADVSVRQIAWELLESLREAHL